jgi:hypothetical protein
MLRRSFNELILWSIGTFVAWMVLYFFVTDKWYSSRAYAISGIFALSGFLLGIINARTMKWKFLPWIELGVWLSINAVGLWAYSMNYILRLNILMTIVFLILFVVNEVRRYFIRV